MTSRQARRVLRHHSYPPSRRRRVVGWGVTTLAAVVTAVLIAAATGSFGKKVAEPSQPLKVTATTDRVSLSVVFPGLYTMSEQMQIDTGSSKVEGLRRQWLAAGASHFDEAGLSIGVRLLNRGERRVRVIGLEVVDLARKPPLNGTLLHLPGQGGADVFRIAFNLDEAGPVPREVDKQGEVRGPFFRHQELELSKGDRDTIWIPVAVSRYSVKFRLKLTYLVGDSMRPQHVTLDDGGLPFALTAVNCPRGVRTYRRVYTSLTPKWDNFQSKLKQVPNPAKYWAPVQARLGPCPQDFASKIKRIAQVTG